MPSAHNPSLAVLRNLNCLSWRLLCQQGIVPIYESVYYHRQGVIVFIILLLYILYIVTVIMYVVWNKREEEDDDECICIGLFSVRLSLTGLLRKL